MVLLKGVLVISVLVISGTEKYYFNSVLSVLLVLWNHCVRHCLGGGRVTLKRARWRQLPYIFNFTDEQTQ